MQDLDPVEPGMAGRPGIGSRRPEDTCSLSDDPYGRTRDPQRLTTAFTITTPYRNTIP